MSTSEVFTEHYAELVATLPMDDSRFVAKLFIYKLLPGNLKQRIEEKQTVEDKATFFLDHAIKPGVSVDNSESFSKLLELMGKSGNITLKTLANKIKTALFSASGEPSLKKQKATPALYKAADKLCKCYQGQLPIAMDEYSWPKHNVLAYVKLALVECDTVYPEDEYIDDLTRLTLQGGGVDVIMKKKKPINNLREIFHYNNQPIPRLILVMGAPGIGKTTLAYEICKKWAKEKFLSNDFNIIILIALRAVQQRSLEDVMVERIGNDAYWELTKTAGEKCLIILEGLDEVPCEQQQSDPLLLNLINILTFENAVMLITSRPHACQNLNANRRIEIVGFGKEQIKSFVELSFIRDSHIANTFMEQLMEHPHIYSLCYVPVSLAMIIHIFKLTKHCLPSTLTKLYQLLTAMTLIRQKKKQQLVSSSVKISTDIESICCEALPNIPKEALGILFSLSKLAYHGFFEKNPTNREHNNQGWRKLSNIKIIFNQTDLSQCNIEITGGGEGLLKVVTITDLIDDHVTYNFIHLTVQEFLCAVYMLTLSQEEQYHLLNDYFDDYPNIIILYCGLTKLDLHKVLYSKLTLYFSVVTAMKCLYEGRWNTTSHKALDPFELNMSYITLLPYDCLCLSYIYCHYPVTKLNLYMCYIRKNVETLAKSCLHKTTKLEELDLGENSLTGQDMEHVMKIVRNSPSLTILDVSENDIGDHGVCFCLQHTNNLTWISFEFCGFSTIGASYIRTILKETNELDYLHIGKNSIGNDGMKLITEGLQNNKTLTTLKACDCGFSVEGAKCIDEVLKINHTLECLDINSNPIGDEGIAAITRTLPNSNLDTLTVYNCNITDTGAISISKMIKMHKILCYLDINSNPIGDDGITAIAENLNNSSIRELIVYNCNITVIGVNKLADSLTYNHTIQLLKLEDNDITVNGAIITLEAAVANGVCQKVNVKDEYKSDDKVKELVSILEEEKLRRQEKILASKLKDEISVLKTTQNEVSTENRTLKRKFEQIKESSEKEILTKKMKISQLEDEVRILETKCSDLVKYKEAMLNKHVERMKLSSKKNSGDLNSSNISITTKILNFGSYYEVYEAQYNGKQCIAKMTDSNKYSFAILLKQERDFLQTVNLDHPCVVKLLDTLDKPKSPVLLMEGMWMSLTKFLNRKPLKDHKNSILQNIACGLHYIHEKGIIHCDLTGDSIWLAENMKAKLSDFGRATLSQQNMVRYSPENLDHMPPEVFEQYSIKRYSTKVDVFSFGCVIIHTFTHERPTPDFDKYVRTSEIGKYIKHSEISRRSVCLKKFENNINSVKLYNIVLTCLHDSPDHRPTAAVLLSSLEGQITLNVTNTFKFVEDICPQVLFTSMRCEISIGILLVEQLRKLTALNVSGYIITDQGADMMAAVLLETISLQNLDLSNTTLNSTKVNKINNSLKKLSSLKHFSININDINDKACETIASFILSNSLMEKINLSYNKIHYTGVLNIANALSKQIKVLDISNNFIVADNITDLVTAISKFHVLQELNLSQNLLTLDNILTIAKTFRDHPTLQFLDLSNNTISFTSACEFIVDVILSVNQTLTNLNVCGRNIRPRYIEDYLSSPISKSNSSKFTFQSLHLLQHSSSHAADTKTKFIKVKETCPFSSKDIISYYVNYLGGAFYNQYYNFAIVIPPGAVTQGDCVEIKVTANYFGPYIIPDGLYPISSCFWVSANYKFKVPVYIIMSHYAKIRNLKDISNLHVLQKCTNHPNVVNKDHMNIVPDGVYFDNKNGYCVLATEHFCTYCGAKSDKDMPEYLTACYYTFEEPSSGSLIAEVCFFPSTYSCRKLVEKQCKNRNTEIKRSVTFDIVNGQELFISSISKVNENEWKLSETGGKRKIIHLRDFAFWKIFHGLKRKEIKKRQSNFNYPPRLQIECVQIDSSKSLYFSFEISKTHDVVIAGFLVIKKAAVAKQAPVQPPNEVLQPPLQNKIFLLKPEVHDFNTIVVPKVSAQWEDIAFALKYEESTVELISTKHNGNPTKCCKELLRNWLATSNGVKPKTWQTLLKKLEELPELNAVTEEITEKLIQKDLLNCM